MHFVTRKDLFALNKDLDSRNRKLSGIKDEHERLESFINWMAELCEKEKLQFCGVRKVKLPNGFNEYMGFAIQGSSTAWHSSKYHSYTVVGFLSSQRNKRSPDYRADVRQELSEIPVSITNAMWLQDNYVKERFRGCGIGSAGMSIVKELAKHLHCTVIYGKKVPVQQENEEDMEKAMRDLTAFYDKNGFSQEEGSDRIHFDMVGYSPKTEISFRKTEDTDISGLSQNESEKERLVLLSTELIRRDRIHDLQRALDNLDARNQLFNEFFLKKV